MKPLPLMVLIAVLVAAGGVLSRAAAEAPASTGVTPVADGDSTQAARNASAPFPSGAEGKLIAYGHDVLTKTRTLMAPYIGAQLSCEACHIRAGRAAHAGSLLGVYAKFPQWNRRAQRFIALQDRIAECFLYSMNGTPPAYSSREMIALTAYIAFLSRGAAVGTGFAHQDYVKITPEHSPSPPAGQAVYKQQCAACHGAGGDGHGGAFPPLWGRTSFNAGAGMHRLPTMAAFVRYNMPYGAKPNTLSVQQAYDVSAYILSHWRPAFAGSRAVGFPALPASYF